MASTVRLGVRPTQKLVDQIVHSVELGNRTETACLAHGVGIRDLEAWLERAREPGAAAIYVDFADRLTKAWNGSEMEMVQEIREAVDGQGNRDWRALAWLLERRDPKRWGLQIQINVREQLQAALSKLEKALPPEVYEFVLAVLSDEDSPQLPAALRMLAAHTSSPSSDDLPG